MFFEVKLKKVLKNPGEGKPSVKLSYLVKAESYTEAEARVAGFIEKDTEASSYSIQKISAAKIHDICKAEIPDSEDAVVSFFKVKALCRYTDESSKEKKLTQIILVKACFPEDVVAPVSKICSNIGDNFEITEIRKTKLSGVIITKSEKQNEGKE